MLYIIGIREIPGKEYEHTRHNVGWMVLDYLVSLSLPSPVSSSKYAGRISAGVLAGEEVMLLYPDTFMNKSGSAVKKLVPKGQEGNLVVVYDDVDIPVGEIKVSFGRGDGGHNGIKSIVASLGTKEFTRVRIGIAPKSFLEELSVLQEIGYPSMCWEILRGESRKICKQGWRKPGLRLRQL